MSKKFSKKTKSIVALVLAVVMVFGMSFAYFSDYAQTSTTGKAGTVAVSVDSNMNLLDADGKDIINPGDLRDAGFTVTNEGNKSIDVRSTIVLTTQSKNAGVDLAFSGTNATQSEYDLYLRSDVEEVEGRGWAPKDGAQPLQVKSIDGDTITYQTPIYSLNGNSDRYDEVETIDGVDAFAQTNDYVLIMKGAAGNEWQNSIVSIDVLVEAKQHENTGAGWDIVAQENVATGAINQSAVKGENVITNGTVSTFIPVISKNENGEDLNASATLIEGQKKADLMNSLDEAGLANSEDVDLLIDVKADDFDGMADTTFDVSNVANEGDTVVILHYDETKGEWEYIATDTVEDGKVGGDFSSYSPVAFIVIPATPSTPEEPVGEGVTFIIKDHNGNYVTDGRVEINAGNPGSSIGFMDNDADGVILVTQEKLGYISMTVTDSMTYCIETSMTDGDQEWQRHVDHVPFTWVEGSVITVVIPAPSAECVVFNVTDEYGNAIPNARVQVNGTCNASNVGWCPIYSVVADENGVANIPVNAFDGFSGPFTYDVTGPGGTGTTGSFDPTTGYIDIVITTDYGDKDEGGEGGEGDNLAGDPETGKAVLVKNSANEPLVGAVVTIYDGQSFNANVVATYVSDENGYVYIDQAYIVGNSDTATHYYQAEYEGTQNATYKTAMREGNTNAGIRFTNL